MKGNVEKLNVNERGSGSGKLLDSADTVGGGVRVFFECTSPSLSSMDSLSLQVEVTQIT